MNSNAVASNAVSSVMGFLLEKLQNNSNTPNLPQSIVILGESNHANQSSYPTNPLQLTSAKMAGENYGYGSPIHGVARILFPANGTATPIPVWVYPQAEAAGAVGKVITITVTGAATSTGTIYLNIAGRESIDGSSYGVNVVSGDSVATIISKISNAVNNALNCPMTETATTVSTVVLTANWYGLTSNDLSVTIDLNGFALGTTFSVATTTPGSATPATATALTSIGNAWRTLIINTYGLVSATIAELEAWNGVPDPTNPTGRYIPTLFKPAFALSGTCLDDPTSITGVTARQSQVTIVPCVAPKSQGMPYEAAANVAYLLASVLQDNPESDVINRVYPDMPGPIVGAIPSMNTQSIRETYVQKGCSTVDFVNGVYKIKDLVTTYNVAGEYPPYYRWVRDLNIYFNYKFAYRLLEETNLIGKTLVPDASVVIVADIIKPKIWKALVCALNENLEKRALLVNVDANNATIQVSINSINQNRLDTIQDIQISGIVRIAATSVYAGFYFGN